MVFSYCKCCQHMAGNPGAAANFYNDHFIPRNWALNYSALSDCGFVTLAGYCKDCYGNLEEAVRLPEGLSGDALLKSIYDTVQTAHPYATFDERTGYYSVLKERGVFYEYRDTRSQLLRSQEFLSMFNDYDREQARLWLEKHFPPQAPEEIFRDTGGSLFCSVVRIAKANGDFDKAEAILDYVLPNEHETGRKERVEITNYEFDFEAVVNYGGSEGIYIDCFLKGKFDGSGRSVLHVGTLKTLKRSLEAAKIMGELCGVLMHYADRYVNRELRRYTPKPT